MVAVGESKLEGFDHGVDVGGRIVAQRGEIDTVEQLESL